MIYLNYKLTTYSDYIHQLAAIFQTTASNGRFAIPPSYGSGYFQVVQLTDAPEALLYDFTLNDTLILKRERDSQEHYTLIFDAVDQEGSFRVTIDADAKNNGMERASVFYLTSFLYDVETVLNKNIHTKGIRILLSLPWMQRYLQLAVNEAVLEKYIALKTAGIWYKPVNDELTTLLHELLNERNTPLLFYQNKILRIIELFFEWLYDEMKLLSGKSGINRHDIEMAQKIEAQLTDDVTQLPPTIKELARDVTMSESKLKKVFKAVYGLPPYEYFQKQRMQKARLMLLSGNY